MLAAIVTLAGLLALLFVEHMAMQKRELIARGAAFDQINAIRLRLETALTAPLLRTRGMVAQIVGHGDVEPAVFERVAAVLLTGHRNVRNITVSRGTVIAMVYPLAGNESVIGADYRNQPQQWPMVERAIRTRNEVLQGPVRLIQGGSALIGRSPVYLPDRNGGADQFYGIVSVVVDIPGVLSEAGLEDESLPLSVAVRGRDGAGAAGELIFGDPAVFAADPVEVDVTLPNGSWRLAAIPKGGWSAGGESPHALHWLGAALMLGLSLTAFGTARTVVLQRASENALRRSGIQLQFFREVMDQSNDAIFLSDAGTGAILDVNRTACGRLGYSREDLLMMVMADIDPGSRERDAKTAETTRTHHRRKDGSFVPVEISVGDVTVDGRTLRLALARDVSERDQAMAERERMYRQMFQSTMAVKLLIDPGSGAIVDANASAARYYGYSLDALKAMRITDLEALQPEEVMAEMAAAATEDRPFVRLRHTLASGELRDVEIFSGPIIVDGQSLLYSIVIDVTDRKRAEEALRRSNEELEAFAVVASHDLQEPLRMITSYLQLLTKVYGGQLSAEADEFIGFAVDGAYRMSRLIQDLLIYSRVARKGQPFAPLDCADALPAALANLQTAIAQAGASVCVGTLPVIEGDFTQLVQLFQNLIGNAIKYRRPDIAPRITIDATRLDRTWTVSVHDNGIGIAPAYWDRIFIIFQRLHGRGEYEGTGIGLAVCKKIVERHGGRIWVDSVPGEGSTFHFTIPAAPRTLIATDAALCPADDEIPGSP